MAELGQGGRSVANITHHLKGIDFPCNKQKLIDHAKKNGADKPILDILAKMKEREYGSMADVMSEYGSVRKAA